MNPERYQQINALLRRALELGDEERARYLAAACGDDQSLRRAVEARVKCDRDLDDFMEDSPAGKVFELLAGRGAESAVGQTVGRFKVESLLGEGGEGARVYKALDTRLGRHVAIKILPRAYIRDSDRQRRFEQEARAASTLSHPNVSTVYEVGQTGDGRHYIVMEYVEGAALHQRLSRGPIKLREALDIAIQVASALTAAHERCIVHRDIKPANIMVGRGGIVKVLDFGLAKLTGQQPPAPRAAGAALVTTNPGVVLGTPAYMSPEQARGQAVDARTDVWGLGCVLYEMCTGRLPFEGETIYDVVASILRRDGGPPPLGQYCAEAPAELELIVKRALSKDREGRYQSMREMLLALEQLRAALGGDESQATPGADVEAAGRIPARETFIKILTGVRRSFSPQLTLTALIVLGLGAAASYVRFERPSPSANVRTLAVLPFKPVTTYDRDETLELGMADTLILRLGGLRDVAVRPISAVQGYNKLGQDPVEAGRQLAVDAVLDGNIQRAGGRVWVSARLVRVRDGRTLWADEFNEEFAGIFAIQDSITERVASSLAPAQAAEGKGALTRHYTDDPEAYQLFLRGRYLFHQRGSDNLNKSIAFLQQAIARDPNFALAYVAQADTYNVISGYGAMRPNESFPKAKTAALHAVELEDTLAEAHAVLAKVEAHYDWDWVGAEKEFRRTFELNPNYANGHYYYALNYLLPMGRFDEALEEMRRAEELDPSSAIIKTNVGLIYYYMRQYDRAIEQYRKALSVSQGNETARLRLIDCYEQKGMYREALEERQKIIVPNGTASPARFAALKQAYDSDPEGRAYLRKTFELEEQRAVEGAEYVSPAGVAKRAARVAETEAAFRWLEKAFPERDEGLTRLGVEPLYDNIRSDPRYEELLRLVYGGNVPPGVKMLSGQFRAN
ncbi:MAG: protein kinase domain-containing protein [Pyrinomonadaceae bacterium]